MIVKNYPVLQNLYKEGALNLKKEGLAIILDAGYANFHTSQATKSLENPIFEKTS